MCCARGVGVQSKDSLLNTRAHSSMWEDFHNGRPTEIDFINGVISREGAECGVPTPANDRVIAMVRLHDTALSVHLRCSLTLSTGLTLASRLRACICATQVREYERRKEAPKLSSRALFALATGEDEGPLAGASAAARQY